MPAVMWRLALLLLGLSAAPALAAESTPQASPRATASLATDVAAVAPGETFRAGLRLRLAPGWHSYWRNAGDAGAPTEISLALPAGATHGEIRWPAPERIDYGPLVNFGYRTEILLPIEVQVPATARPGDTFRIAAEATWLVCAELCIPEEGSFALNLPVSDRVVPSPAMAPLFEAAEARIPRAAPWTVQAGVSGRQGSLTLSGPGLSPELVREAFFFPFSPGVIANAAPQPVAWRDGALTLGQGQAEETRPEPLAGTVVLRDAGGQRVGFDLTAPVVGPAMAGPVAPYAMALLLALLGGLILNLMPCVFPVLAMKAMALARMSGEAKREVRLHAASYTAGVLVSFAAIGGALLALRAGGVAVGWGFQFTQPAFVAGMAWLMLAVALNLMGVFSVRPVGAGHGLAARGGHLGAFFTGTLAVLLATPCTAPFMAAALGAALAMDAPSAMLVFLALGLGMAAPYALLGLFPSLARLLPRPGAWMERLRQALAFPMLAAAAWLVWVFARQSGSEALGLLLLAAVPYIGKASRPLSRSIHGPGRGRRDSRPGVRLTTT